MEEFHSDEEMPFGISFIELVDFNAIKKLDERLHSLDRFGGVEGLARLLHSDHKQGISSHEGKDGFRLRKIAYFAHFFSFFL